MTAATYTREQLEGMTVTQIRELAAHEGYAVGGSLKNEIIDSFLAEQEGGGG